MAMSAAAEEWRDGSYREMGMAYWLERAAAARGASRRMTPPAWRENLWNS